MAGHCFSPRHTSYFRQNKCKRSRRVTVAAKGLISKTQSCRPLCTTWLKKESRFRIHVSRVDDWTKMTGAGLPSNLLWIVEHLKASDKTWFSWRRQPTDAHWKGYSISFASPETQQDWSAFSCSTTKGEVTGCVLNQLGLYCTLFFKQHLPKTITEQGSNQPKRGL